MSSNESRVASTFNVDDFFDFLTRTNPGGNSAYAVGLRAAFEKLNNAPEGNEQVLILFVGATEPTPSCADADKIIWSEILEADEEIPGTCVFTFMNEAEYRDYQTLLETRGIDCNENITSEQEVEAVASSVVTRVQYVRTLPINPIATPIAPQPTDNRFLATPTSTEAVVTQESEDGICESNVNVYRVSISSSNVRSAPGITGRIVRTVDLGHLFQVYSLLTLEGSGVWYRVDDPQLDDGGTEWIYSGDVVTACDGTLAIPTETNSAPTTTFGTTDVIVSPSPSSTQP